MNENICQSLDYLSVVYCIRVDMSCCVMTMIQYEIFLQ